MTSSLTKIIFLLLSYLPLRWLHSIGGWLGRITFATSKQYAALTQQNLQQAHLAKNDEQYETMLRQAIAEGGKSIIELPWVWCRPYEEVCSTVRSCQGWNHVEFARAQGNGIIFLTPHWGCFEITALYIAQFFPVTSLYRQPRQGWLEEVMRNGRERGQAHLAKADLSGVRLLFKALRRGEAIGMLPDQVPSQGEGEWANFFSRPAYTMTLIGRLAQTSNAAVLLIYAERLNHGAGYQLNIEPLPLDFSKSVPLQINAALERVIAVAPAQYLWSYNRYKIPAGVIPPASQGSTC